MPAREERLLGLIELDVDVDEHVVQPHLPRVKSRPRITHLPQRGPAPTCMCAVSTPAHARTSRFRCVHARSGHSGSFSKSYLREAALSVLTRVLGVLTVHARNGRNGSFSKSYVREAVAAQAHTRMRAG